MYAVSGFDVIKYNETKKLSALNYYLYIEVLEAERQRAEKRNKK